MATVPTLKVYSVGRLMICLQQFINDYAPYLFCYITVGFIEKLKKNLPLVVEPLFPGAVGVNFNVKVTSEFARSASVSEIFIKFLRVFIVVCYISLEITI